MNEAAATTFGSVGRPMGWITAASIMAIFIALAAFQYVSLPSRARENLETALDSKGDALVRVVAHTITPAVDFEDTALVEEVFRGVMQDPEVDFVVLSLSTGAEVHQARPGVDHRRWQALEPHRVVGELLLVTAPILVGGDERGRLRIGLSTRRIDAESARARQVAGAISIVLLAIGAATGALATLFVRRAQQLAEVDAARTRAESVAAAKDEFLATMSHEIRTPLNAVMGMAQNLLDSPLDPRQMRACRSILEAGESLLALLDRHLDLAKLDARSLAIDSRPFDVRATVEAVARRFAHVAERRDLDLVTDVAPTVPARVRGDALRIEQMVGNLVANALKFTRQGEVVVAVDLARPEGGPATLRVEVRDTGIGISPEAVGRLFRRFSQASDTTAREYGGTGLGLSLVRRLAEAMGGRAGVESTLGTGSTFWFEVEAEIEPAAPTDPRLAGTAIYVSSSPSRRASMARRFESWGADALVMEPMAALGGAGPPVLLVVDEECIGEADLSPERIVALAAKAPIAVLAPISRPPVAAAIETATVLERPASSAALLAVARAAVQRSAEPRADPGAVLIVEDNPLNQEVAAVMLRSLGYRTTVVDDGPSAVGLVARGERFDAILMDGQMPGMSGFEASRSIRELEAAKGLPRTPIIACTAGERDRVSAIARDAGMDHILSKPLVKPALVSVLSQLDGSPPVRTSAVAAEEPVGPIDTRVLAGLSLLEQEDGSPLLPSLLASYREKMATGLARLEDLTRAHAGEEAAAVAHHLKGSSLQLGARLVAGSLREVEHACAASDFALALARLESVRGAQVAALAELEARVRT